MAKTYFPEMVPTFPLLLPSVLNIHFHNRTYLLLPSPGREHTRSLKPISQGTKAGLSIGPNICWTVFGPILVQDVHKLNENLCSLTFKCGAFSINLDKGVLRV